MGFAFYPHVPQGNFTVDVFYQNRQVAFAVPIDTYTEDVVVYTTVPHFPIFVVTFAAISAVLGVVGFIIYKKARS